MLLYNYLRPHPYLNAQTAFSQFKHVRINMHSLGDAVFICLLTGLEHACWWEMTLDSSGRHFLWMQQTKAHPRNTWWRSNMRVGASNKERVCHPGPACLYSVPGCLDSLTLGLWQHPLWHRGKLEDDHGRYSLHTPRDEDMSSPPCWDST